MPPKKNQQKNNLKSKEEKRLEQYLNHPANIASQENQNNQGKKGGKNTQKGGAAEQSTQNDTENQIAQLLKEVDINQPLPDFTPFENQLKNLKSTLESMDTLVENIMKNNTQAFGEPPKDEEESSFKNTQLTPDIIQKRDQIIKDVKKTIEVYQQKKDRIDELLKQENMSDLKDQLLITSQNLAEDIKSKEQILNMF